MRLIDADALLENVENLKSNLYGWQDYNTGVEGAVYKIETAPTVDAVEVVHGRWEDVALRFTQTKEKCSVCGGIVYAHGYNYCPNCGAKMDLEASPDGDAK